MAGQPGQGALVRRGKAPPTNLPVVRDPLVGREREVADACDRLVRDDLGLLTLTGVGGSGKTRLALRVAAEMLDRFDDGVFFVELAPVRDPTLVAARIVEVLGLVDLRGQEPEIALVEHVRHRQLLLVLDNLEHLPDAAPLLGDCLARAPGLKLLVTSRAALRLRDEHELTVLPLAVPTPGATPAVKQLLRFGAVELFVRRAAAVQPGFELTADNAGAVAAICARVDGLPLAIELAAARLRLLTPREILARLERRLPLLTGGARDVPDRHRSLRATLAWSHDLLSESERRRFRRLSVFAGGWTVSTTEEVCRDGGEDEVLDAMTGLVGHNLVQRYMTGDPPRYTMLETVREYAEEQLRTSGEEDDLRQRHLDSVTELAETADAGLWSKERFAWLARLRAEHDNVRSALTWSLTDERRAEQGLQIVGALYWFWRLGGHRSEARRWLDQLLERAAPATSTHGRARALWCAGMTAYFLNEYEQAEARFEASIAIWRGLGEDRWLTHALSGLALVRRIRGDYAARSLNEEAVATARRLGDRRCLADALFMQGSSPGTAEDHAIAPALLEESVAIFRELGDDWALARPLLTLGIGALQRGQLDDARPKLEEALSVFRTYDDGWYAARALSALGRIARADGRRREASTLYREAMRCYRDLADWAGVADCLEGLAGTRRPRGGDDARLLSAADSLRADKGIRLDPVDRAAFDDAVAAVRARLGADRFDTAWRRGRAVDGEQVLAEVLGGEENATAIRLAPDARGLDVLSPREREVAALIAQGHTNRQLAEALGITERTAEVHARNIREKLGVSTRSQIAAWATEQGLQAAATVHRLTRRSLAPRPADGP